MRKIVIISFLLSILIGCQKNQKRDTETRTYQDICAGYDAIDKEMLDVIEVIETENKSNIKFLERFRNEQIYWIQYKDRRMRALYPEDWDLYYRKNYGKQVFNACKCKELIRMTDERVTELRIYLNGNGPEDQRDCPTSWNKKSAQ